MHTRYSVSFKITDVSHGFQEAKGLLTISDEALNFEFDVSDTIIGIFKSGLKTISIPYENLKSIAFKKGFISSKIVLVGTSMRALSELPGVDVATCVLKIKRKERKQADQLVSSARVWLSEFRLSQMEE